MSKREESPPARNYWNTSGKGKEFFPTAPAADCVPIVNRHGYVLEEPKNEWWINSKKHHFCFWTFLRDHSQADGSMNPLIQTEIAQLFGVSPTKILIMLQEAMDQLMSSENMEILKDLEALVGEDSFNETEYVRSLPEAQVESSVDESED